MPQGLTHTRRLLLAAVLLSAIFFTLGITAARWFAPSSSKAIAPRRHIEGGASWRLAPPPQTPGSLSPVLPAEAPSAAAPTVIVDPSAIQLLPDASLTLELGPSGDASARE